MIRKITFFLLILILVTCTCAKGQAIAGSDSTGLNLTAPGSKWEYGTGYFWPTPINNQISTITLDIYYWKNYFKKIDLRFHVGVVAAYAQGYVKGMTDDKQEIENVRYPTRAAGIGPTLMIQYPFIVFRSFSVEAEISSSFLVFTNRFPYGGYIYDFMFRTGPNVCWNPGPGLAFKMGYRWYHLSNGTGAGPQNPWYNARGLTLSVVRFIR